MSKTLQNFYTYEQNCGRVRGAFNVYQAVNGGIYLCMANCSTRLTRDQINELGIDVYSLVDFDFEAYCKAYQVAQK